MEFRSYFKNYKYFCRSVLVIVISVCILLYHKLRLKLLRRHQLNSLPTLELISGFLIVY